MWTNVKNGVQNADPTKMCCKQHFEDVLAIIRTTFEKPERIPLAAKDLSATLFLLRNLADATEQESLKRQIAEMMAHGQAHRYGE
jgi:hypothetical protein